MYCINCGVELSAGQTVCPICETKVYHPDIKPEKVPPKFPHKPLRTEITAKHGVLAVISATTLFFTLFTLFLDLLLIGQEGAQTIIQWWAPGNLHIEWGHFVIGATLVLYAIFIVPLWCKRIYPVLVASMVFASGVLYLLFIAWQTNGWNWFLPFALPTVAFLGILTVISIAICEFLPNLRLVCLGSAFLLVSGFVIVLELLMDLVFNGAILILWSPFVSVLFLVVSILLFACAIFPELRASLKKIFFL